MQAKPKNKENQKKNSEKRIREFDEFPVLFRALDLIAALCQPKNDESMIMRDD